MEIIIILVIVLAVYFIFIHKKDKKEQKENTEVQYFYTDFELKLIDEVNNYRKSINLQEVKVSNYISQICLEHNSYMQKQGKASHDNFENRSERIVSNLDVYGVGENVAYNFSTPRATLHAWLQSPSHKENLENSKWNIMGVSNFSKYSTNIFAQLKNN